MRIKRIVVVILALLFAFISTGFSPVSARAEEIDLPSSEEQAAAVAANDLLWSVFTLDQSGMPVYYPEDYGGAFIQDGLLYIYIVELDDEKAQKYSSICEDSPVVRFIDAEYSANYLCSLADEIQGYIRTYSIVGYGVDFARNRFLVNICDMNKSQEGTSNLATDVGDAFYLPFEEQKTMLSEDLNNPAIVIEESSCAHLASTNLVGGDLIMGYSYANSYVNSFSLGIGGTYNGSPAVLTAGHALATSDASGSQKVYYVRKSGTQIGSVGSNAFRFHNGQSGDWGIISITNSNYIPTNLVHYLSSTASVSITSTATSYVSGQYICIFGQQSGHHFAVMGSYNYTYCNTAGNYTITGLCRTQQYSGTPTQVGDSGGPVYAASGSSYTLLGTFTGHETQYNVDYLLFSPIGLAMANGFTPYTY